MRSLWAIIIIVIGIAQRSQALSCFDCNVYSAGYNGYPAERCFHSITSGTGALQKKTCIEGGATSVAYCVTRFEIQDGVVTEAHRGCELSTSDHDTNTNAVPSSDKCVSSLYGSRNVNDRTTCYYSCTTDDCNTKSAKQVKKCKSDCNSGLNRGSCDYITGNCVCNSGSTSANCGTQVTDTLKTTYIPRKCVQCNSETDTTCVISTLSQNCPARERYCSTATTWIYDLADVVVKTVTTRGCTDDYKAVDECSFTNIFTDSPISDRSVGYNEFTCYSSCDSDGCNTNTANGQLNPQQGEEIPLFCVQCSDTYGIGSCNRSRTRCPSGSTHCKSTVTYLISDAVDALYRGDAPAYKLRSVVRECVTASVKTQCTEEKFSTIDAVKKVTCTETCQIDGCNTGWPARPKCISCRTDVGASASGYDGCLENPPEPKDCFQPYHKYCYIIDMGIEKDKRSTVQGYPRRIYRGCTDYDIGTGCSSATPRSTDIQKCNRTCTTDGCNVGSGSLFPMQGMAAVFASLLLGWILQPTI